MAPLYSFCDLLYCHTRCATHFCSCQLDLVRFCLRCTLFRFVGCIPRNAALVKLFLIRRGRKFWREVGLPMSVRSIQGDVCTQRQALTKNMRWLTHASFALKLISRRRPSVQAFTNQQLFAVCCQLIFQFSRFWLIIHTNHQIKTKILAVYFITWSTVKLFHFVVHLC